MEYIIKVSYSKRFRHMNIRYFHVKDLVDRKEVSVDYCLIDRIIADFFTKPLQGILLTKFRDTVL